MEVPLGRRLIQEASALSSRFVVFKGSLNSINAYDRNSGSTTEIVREFAIEVHASNTHVVWQRPFESVFFLRGWEAASGNVFLIDTERGHAFGRREFVGDRLFYSDGLDRYIKVWDPSTGLVEQLPTECNFEHWDAAPGIVAWSCSFDDLIVLYDVARGVVVEIPSPPQGNARPRRVVLARDWVVWVAERTAEMDILAAPLAGGPIRALATGLPRRGPFGALNAAGRFAAWWDDGRIRLHDLDANETIDVGSDVVNTPPILSPRYLTWLEGTRPPQAMHVRNLITGLEVPDGPEEFRFRNLRADEDSLVYWSDAEHGVLVFELDGDGDGLRDRDERRFALGDLDVFDTDGDGVPDGAEDPDADGISSSTEIDTYRTSPTLLDSDSDGLSDPVELFVLETSALSVDSDGDGLDDGAEDADGDGLPNAAELGPDPVEILDTDRDGLPDVLDDDDDGDGVPTLEDACPTDPAEVVNADGCSIHQLCPCEGDWKNHRAYVRCVARVARDFAQAGLITRKERRHVVWSAVRSGCGRHRAGSGGQARACPDFSHAPRIGVDSGSR